MRRLSMVATFALLLAVPCALGQRRGGSMGGGMRMGGAPSGVRFAGNRSFITTVPRDNGVRFISSFHNRRFRSRGFFFFGFPYFNPWLWDSSFDPPDPRDDQNRQLAQQVNELSNEVVRLRQEQEARAWAPPPQPAAAPVPAKPEPVIFTVLVFQDRHREEIQNYAVVGRTLWVFNQDRARRIPLAQLDLPATSRANDERGVDFAIPR